MLGGLGSMKSLMFLSESRRNFNWGAYEISKEILTNNISITSMSLSMGSGKGNEWAISSTLSGETFYVHRIARVYSLIHFL